MHARNLQLLRNTLSIFPSRNRWYGATLCLWNIDSHPTYSILSKECTVHMQTFYIHLQHNNRNARTYIRTHCINSAVLSTERTHIPLYPCNLASFRPRLLWPKIWAIVSISASAGKFGQQCIRYGNARMTAVLISMFRDQTTQPAGKEAEIKARR